MGDRVEVDLASLTAFAKAVNGLAADHSDAAVAHSEALIQTSEPIFYAGEDFHEARLFADQHHRLARSVQLMLKDTVAGLDSLGSGAEFCAVNYADSDQRNAAAQRRVDGDSDATSVRMTGTSTIPTAGVDEAFGPSQTNEYVSPGNSPEELLARKEAGVDWRYPTSS